MVREITVRQVGGSVGATLPKDMADRLHVVPGDRLLAIETEHGILLTPYDPDTEESLAIAAGLRNAIAVLSAPSPGRWRANRAGSVGSSGSQFTMIKSLSTAA